MNDTEIKDFKKSIKKTGTMPLHNMGSTMIDKIVEELQPLKDQLQDAINGASKVEVDLNFKIEDTQIIGKVSSLYGNNFIGYCNSSDNLKYVLSAFVSYLGLIAQGLEEVQFIFVSKGNENRYIPAGNITQKEAIEILTKYMHYLKSGHIEYFNFYPVLGSDGMKMIAGEYDSFWDAYQVAKGNDRSYIFENEYLDLAVSNGFFSEDAYPKIQENVKAVFEPLMKHLPELFA
jgi:exonuclease V gamma subunit